MDIKEAYNLAATIYSKKYDRLPVRKREVDEVLSLVEVNKPRVLEVGYGSGREAEYITTQVAPDDYVGLDISENMQVNASERLPDANFLVGDIVTWETDEQFDVTFAFASLLHLDDGALRGVFVKFHRFLNDRGVVFVSLKRRAVYETDLDNDGITERRFWYYTREKLLELSEELFEEVKYEEQELNESWLTLILRKK